MVHIYRDKLVILVDVMWGLNLVVGWACEMVVVKVVSSDGMKAALTAVVMGICLVF